MTGVQTCALPISTQLIATASSGLAVQFEVLSGSATISGNMLTVNGIGTIKIGASQNGDNEYSPALRVNQTFTLLPEGINVALNKPVSVSSIYSATTTYTSDKVVDGNKTDNASRWLTDQNGSYPHWIEIDLQNYYSINAVGFWTGYSGYNLPVESFEFQRWDGNAWQKIFEETGNLNPEYIKSFSHVQTNKVRLHLTAGANPLRMFELEVFGSIVSSVNSFFKPEVRVYPNPINESSITIKGVEKIEKMCIFDSKGTMIPASFINNKISVDHLKKGVYLIRINDIFITKFIK